MSPIKNLSQIKYLTNKESVTNKVFVDNQVFIDNHVFIWKISWQYFGSEKSSICLKDHLTILWHHISERSKDTILAWACYLFERSIDNTSADQIIPKMFFFSKKNLEFFLKNFLSAYHPDQLISKSARSDQLIRSNQQVISDQSFSSGHLT